MLAAIAARRSDPGEVALGHGGGRNECRELSGIRAQRRPLISAEEEQFVLPDRPADGASVLIPFQRVALHREKVAGIQVAIPQKFKQVPMKLVGARFGDGVDGETGGWVHGGRGERAVDPVGKAFFLANAIAQSGGQRAAAHPLEVTDMSSPEELTFVVGRWLRPLAFVLDVVRRFKSAPTSSREQVSTEANH